MARSEIVDVRLSGQSPEVDDQCDDGQIGRRHGGREQANGDADAAALEGSHQEDDLAA